MNFSVNARGKIDKTLVIKNELSCVNVVLYIQGAGILQSEVVQGMVFKRQVEGDVTKADNAKIAVFSCPLDSMQTETKVKL